MFAKYKLFVDVNSKKANVSQYFQWHAHWLLMKLDLYHSVSWSSATGIIYRGWPKNSYRYTRSRLLLLPTPGEPSMWWHYSSQYKADGRRHTSLNWCHWPDRIGRSDRDSEAKDRVIIPVWGLVSFLSNHFWLYWLSPCSVDHKKRIASNRENCRWNHMHWLWPRLKSGEGSRKLYPRPLLTTKPPYCQGLSSSLQRGRLTWTRTELCCFL